MTFSSLLFLSRRYIGLLVQRIIKITFYFLPSDKPTMKARWSALVFIFIPLVLLETSKAKPRGKGKGFGYLTFSEQDELSLPCKAEKIDQTIQEKGCEPKVIHNKICIGQCFSYYAPGIRPRKDLTNKRVKYCDTCKPSLRSWTKVSLNCPGAKHPHVDKLVEVIYDCTCQKCVRDSKSKHRPHRKKR